MSRLKNTGSLRKVTPQVVPHTEGLSEKILEKRPAVSSFRVSTKGQADDEKSGLDRQEAAEIDGLTQTHRLYPGIETVLEVLQQSNAKVTESLQNGKDRLRHAELPLTRGPRTP